MVVASRTVAHAADRERMPVEYTVAVAVVVVVAADHIAVEDKIVDVAFADTKIAGCTDSSCLDGLKSLQGRTIGLEGSDLG